MVQTEEDQIFVRSSSFVIVRLVWREQFRIPAAQEQRIWTAVFSCMHCLPAHPLWRHSEDSARSIGSAVCGSAVEIAVGVKKAAIRIQAVIGGLAESPQQLLSPLCPRSWLDQFVNRAVVGGVAVNCRAVEIALRVCNQASRRERPVKRGSRGS